MGLKGVWRAFGWIPGEPAGTVWLENKNSFPHSQQKVKWCGFSWLYHRQGVNTSFTNAHLFSVPYTDEKSGWPKKIYRKLPLMEKWGFTFL